MLEPCARSIQVFHVVDVPGAGGPVVVRVVWGQLALFFLGKNLNAGRPTLRRGANGGECASWPGGVKLHTRRRPAPSMILIVQEL